MIEVSISVRKGISGARVSTPTISMSHIYFIMSGLIFRVNCLRSSKFATLYESEMIKNV